MKTVTDAVETKKKIRLKNRLVMAPMGTQQSLFNDCVSLNDLVYYGNRSGAPAMIITGAAQVQANGRTMPGMFGVYSDKHIGGLTQLSKIIKRTESKAILQIFHAGRMTSSKNNGGNIVVSPSPIKSERLGFDEPQELTPVEIEKLINDFEKATLRAIQAGFDGIELHGAHTYIIQQFFSPHSNQRSDEWGGTVERRYHFIDILTNRISETIKNSSNPQFIFGYRISPEEYETPGIRFEDTLFLVEHLVEKSIDYLHVSTNHYLKVSSSKKYRDFPMLKYIQKLTTGKTLLMGVGGVRTNRDIETILEYCDLIAIGSPMIADNNFAEKLLNDEAHNSQKFKQLPKMSDFDNLFDYVQGIRNDKINYLEEKL